MIEKLVLWAHQGTQAVPRTPAARAVAVMVVTVRLPAGPGHGGQGRAGTDLGPQPRSRDSMIPAPNNTMILMWGGLYSAAAPLADASAAFPISSHESLRRPSGTLGHAI